MNGPLENRILEDFGDTNTGFLPTLWEDHCTECAVPDCYKSCTLYRPTRNGRCSRLQTSNKDESGLLTITPLRWAKLETPLIDISLRLPLHKIFKSLVPLRITVNLDGHRNLVEVFIYRFFSYVLRRIGNFLHNTKTRNYSYFIYGNLNSKHESKVSLELSLRDFHTNETITKTNFLVEDDAFLIPIITANRTLFLNKTNAPLVSLSFREESVGLPIIVRDLGIVKRRKSSVSLENLKCVFWDLDNTLWEGRLLFMDNTENLKLKVGIRYLLETLNKQGILNVAVSKNIEDEANNALHQLGINTLFYKTSIGWQPKSKSISDNLEFLKFLPEHCLFIDDENFELQEVKSAIEGINVLHARDVLEIYSLTLAPERSEITMDRAQLYRTEDRRLAESEGFESYYDFVKMANMSICFYPMGSFIDRAYELFSRSNQLNLSGYKPTLNEIRSLSSGMTNYSFVAGLTDKYGDYGIVAAGLAEYSNDIIRIKNLAISCRAMSRYVELGIIRHLINRFCDRKFARIEAYFVKTPRNLPLETSLKAIGFWQTEKGQLVLEGLEELMNQPFPLTEN